MNIELTNEEALVLFEWLAQKDDQDELFSHQAEQYVMWTIRAQLEKALLEPCLPDYHELVAKARDCVERSY